MIELTAAPATLPPGERVYAIGDIHGCLDRLVALHICPVGRYDQRLFLELCLRIDQRGLRALQICRGIFHCDLEITRIEFNKELPRRETGIIRHMQSRNIGRHFGNDRDRIGLHIGIVRLDHVEAGNINIGGHHDE